MPSPLGLSEDMDPQLTSFGDINKQADEELAAERLKRLIEFRQTEEGKALAKFITGSQKKMENAREKEARQWKINLSFFNKIHDVVVASGSGTLPAGQLHSPSAGAPKKKRVVNRIRSMVRTELAKFLAQKPGIYVVPASSEDEDMFAAQAGEQAYRSVANRRDFHGEFSKAAFWLSIAGNGFMKAYWNEQLWDEESQLSGDIIYESITPFNIFVPNLREEDIERQPYVLHMYTQTPEWAKSFYAAELEGVELQAVAASANSVLDEAFSSRQKEGNVTRNDSVLVYEMWIKPNSTKYLPKGGLVIMVNETIVSYYDEGIPYTHGKFPFAHMKHVPSGGFYGLSVIEDLIDLQLEYNETRQHISRARVRMGMAQFAAQRGSIVPSKMNNLHGTVVEYKAGTPAPTVLPISQMPSYILQDLDRILTDMEDISGQHQVSKGNAPPGLTAATAISFLQEKDDSYMVPSFQSIERFTEKIGRMTLSLMSQYWDVARMVKVVGTDGEFDAMQFSRSEIANGTDLRVEPGSALPESKAAKQAFILDLMNMGAIPMDKGLEMLEIGGSQKLMAQLQVDKQQAQRENIIMKKVTQQDIAMHEQQWQEAVAQQQGLTIDKDSGQSLETPPIVPVNSFDNHEIHIETHNAFRKSQAFDSLPPEVKEIFERHVNDHKMAMQEDMLQQLLSQIPQDESVGQEEMPPGGEEEMAPEVGGPPPGEALEGETMAPTEEAGI